MMKTIDKPVTEWKEVVHRIDAAAAGKNGEAVGEDEKQDEAKPELGKRCDDQRRGPGDPVRERPPTRRLPRAESYSPDEAQHERRRHEQERIG